VSRTEALLAREDSTIARQSLTKKAILQRLEFLVLFLEASQGTSPLKRHRVPLTESMLVYISEARLDLCGDLCVELQNWSSKSPQPLVGNLTQICHIWHSKLHLLQQDGTPGWYALWEGDLRAWLFKDRRQPGFSWKLSFRPFKAFVSAIFKSQGNRHTQQHDISTNLGTACSHPGRTSSRR
jgi:hypothetical protein